MLYWLGDLCWRVNDLFLAWINERLWRQWLFDLYQWVMRTAIAMQGNGLGPWEKENTGFICKRRHFQAYSGRVDD